MCPSNLSIEGVSSFVGAAISVTLCSPLDIMRVRFQIMGQHSKIYYNYLHTITSIYKKEGLTGFYKGYSISIASIPVFNAFYFTFYSYFKQKLLPKFKHHTTAYALSSGISGLMGNIFMNPMWIIKTRMQANIFKESTVNLRTLPSITKEVTELLQKEGYSGFFKGITPSLFGICNPIIYFPLYESLKELFASYKSIPMPVYVMLSTIIAKCIILIKQLLAVCATRMSSLGRG